jgi:16S rRNA (cytosine1402-N4)-methyltransferase
VRLVASVFDQLPQVLVQAGVTEVDGVLFDLGASSFQLDVASRGFSYAVDAPLDMRMDPALPRTAADVLNDYSVEELTSLFRTYGEERFARRIAQLVVRSRAKAPFTTSRQLVELIYAAVPAPARRSGGHPAKRVFQALRIEVNAELDALRDALPAALQALRVEGRLVVLAYHSLEDRMVKSFLVSRARSATPPGLPVELPSAAPTVRLLTRGAERPSAAEVTANPRAASARLRAAEKLRYAA